MPALQLGRGARRRGARREIGSPGLLRTYALAAHMSLVSTSRARPTAPAAPDNNEIRQPATVAWPHSHGEALSTRSKASRAQLLRGILLLLS